MAPPDASATIKTNVACTARVVVRAAAEKLERQSSALL
jgi:hypothetical protein